MWNIIKYICFYFICLMFVNACWIGLEYTIDGAVHSSDVDSIIAIVLSYFITDKYIGGIHNET